MKKDNKQKVKLEHIKSRSTFGPLRPGSGRKTKFTDKKKQKNKDECNQIVELDDYTLILFLG